MGISLLGYKPKIDGNSADAGDGHAYWPNLKPIAFIFGHVITGGVYGQRHLKLAKDMKSEDSFSMTRYYHMGVGVLEHVPFFGTALALLDVGIAVTALHVANFAKKFFASFFSKGSSSEESDRESTDSWEDPKEFEIPQEKLSPSAEDVLNDPLMDNLKKLKEREVKPLGGGQVENSVDEVKELSNTGKPEKKKDRGEENPFKWKYKDYIVIGCSEARTAPEILKILGFTFDKDKLVPPSSVVKRENDPKDLGNFEVYNREKEQGDIITIFNDQKEIHLGGDWKGVSFKKFGSS
ncbi:MAG: hypothetical protein V4489_07190 [Chlamydiota bacterium]